MQKFIINAKSGQNKDEIAGEEKSFFDFLKFNEDRLHELEAALDALDKSQAIIEFDMAGKILRANQRFLKVMGYRLDEIQGEHHRIFVDPKEASGASYVLLWESLNKGEFKAAEYRLLGKDGKEVRIHASYIPVLDVNGKPFKVVKYAIAITNIINLAEQKS